MSAGALPIIDIAPLVAGLGGTTEVEVARRIDEACREHGFFYVVGHGVAPELQERLDRLAREFFALAEEQKAEIAMSRGGRAWRGWFPVGGELTSGRPDRKEGIYFGTELAADHPRVVEGVVLHGANLFPREPIELGATVLEYLAALTDVGHALARGVSLGLGHDPDWFRRTLTADPVILFRIFHYPPDPAPDEWGVGEHTDYGLLTLLLQDDNGGLQVRGPDGWIDAPPVPGSFVCNLGDVLERMTGGRYRSTAHRVQNTSGAERLSFPFFFDPGWEAVIDDDGTTYGDYVSAKVARVFPDLHAEVARDPQA
jgi:isopenicillin N synthase-like dioxygenase